LRQGARAYFAANMAAQMFALLRYVVLARLLGPFELGLAAALLLTVQFFGAVSDTGADRFLVQDKDGDSQTMQGVVHTVLAARGVLIAIGMVLTAGLVATFYKSPQLQSSLMVLCLVPLILGFTHLDLRRVQRTGDFRPESTAMLVSESLSLLTTAVAAWYTRDHTAVIYGQVVRAAAIVAVSHFTAKRAYRWAFAGPQARIFAAFAAPLSLNGLLLFIGSQGDRVVVGGSVGPETLGYYTAILLLVYYPTTMVGRFLSGMHLPLLAGAKTDDAAFKTQQSAYAARMVLLSAAIITGFAVVGPIAAPILYGAAFAQPLHLYALLATLQTLRFARLWPTNVAVSLGRSWIVLLNNIARMAAIPLAVGAVALFGSLEAIVGAFLLGEIAALIAALSLLARAGAVSPKQELLRVGVLLGGASATIATAWSFQDGHSILGATAAVATASFWLGLVALQWRALAGDIGRARRIFRL
jgi:O-antigen/teichoic acid export membrane protein